MAGDRRAQTFSALAKARGLTADPASPGRVSIPVEVVKAAAPDDEKRLVYGWVSVIEKGGKPVVDLQGDEMDADTLQAAAHGYIRNSRIGKRQHAGKPTMELVESVVLTKAVQGALGIDLGREGWFGCWYVHDDATWEAAKQGKLPGFSLGGRGVRTPLENEDAA